MRGKFTPLALCAIILPSFSVGQEVGTAREQAETIRLESIMLAEPEGKIEVSAVDLVPGKLYELTVPLVNGSGSILKFGGLTTSCKCVRDIRLRKELRNNEKEDLTFRYRAPLGYEIDRQEIRVSVLEPTKGWLRIGLELQVKQQVKLDRDSLRFSRNGDGTYAEAVFSLRLEDFSADIDEVSVTPLRDYIELRRLPSDLTHNNTIHLAAVPGKFQPVSPSFVEVLRIQSSGDDAFAKDVPVSCNREDPIQIYPDSVFLRSDGSTDAMVGRLYVRGAVDNVVEALIEIRDKELGEVTIARRKPGLLTLLVKLSTISSELEPNQRVVLRLLCSGDKDHRIPIRIVLP